MVVSAGGVVCSLNQAGVISGEGAVPADADGLARLVIDRDTDGRAVVEIMSGAIWVRTRRPARLCSPPPHRRGLARGRRNRVALG